LQFLVVKTQVFSQNKRVSHLLDHYDIGPKTENHHGTVLFSHLSEFQPGKKQAELDFFFRQRLPVWGIIVNADQIVIPFRGPRRWCRSGAYGQLVFYHEIKIHHVMVQCSDALVGKNT
jgi:hypothetical protein